jgi:hypothetical protein
LWRKNREKRQKYFIPTEEEMLKYRPLRAKYSWKTNEDGLVEIKIPKFNSKIGKSFCNLVRKENYFIATMDKIGTIVWKNSNGKKTVKEILDQIIKSFPSEDNLDQRLYLFLQQMKNLDYIYL